VLLGALLRAYILSILVESLGGISDRSYAMSMIDYNQLHDYFVIHVMIVANLILASFGTPFIFAFILFLALV